ncbi:MAG: tetratricopeptide repeat protein [Spirochaetota bacterium]|nr:MAG: tetratricopeptide repeat protein [Spirochaetota bacterium]
MTVKSFFKKIFLTKLVSNRKRSFEFLIPIVLIILGVTTYLILSQKKVDRVSYEADFRDKTLINALYHYRLENLDRAELLFDRALQESKFKKKKSLAELFLGGIYFKRELYEEAIEHYERAVTYNKKNIHALNNIALSYTKMDDINHALSYAQKVYSMKKDLDENLLLLGNIYFTLGRFEEALSMYRLGNAPADIFAYNRARVHAQLGDIETALNIFQSIVDDQQSSSVIRGLSLIWIGLLQEKEDVVKIALNFERALEVFPLSDLLRYNLAVTLLKGEQYEMAVASLKAMGEATKRKAELLGFALYRSSHYREALDHYSNMRSVEVQAEHYYISGDLHVKLGQLSQAKPFYEKTLEDSWYEGAFINLFRIYFKEGLYENAKRLCYEFIKNDDSNPLPHVLLADVFFQEGLESEARSYLDIAVALSREGIVSLTRIAEVYYKYGYFNNALYLYHMIRDLKPDHYQAAIRIAEIYLLTGHEQKAKATLERTREMISEIDEYYRVSILLAGCEEIESASALYRRMIDDFPYRYEAYYNLSILYIETGGYEEAIQIIEQCFQTVPGLDTRTLSELYSILGFAQLHLGRVVDAARQFQEARKLDKNNEIPVINLRRMGYLSQ